MSIFTITNKDKDDYEIFFSPDSYEDIGKKGYFTMAATDDEAFVAGVIQFFVGEDIRKGVTASITYLYVDEEFRNEGIGTLLISRLKDVLYSSGITQVTAEIFGKTSDGLKPFLEKEGFKASGEVLYGQTPLISVTKKTAIKNADISKCKSISELTNAQYISILKSIDSDLTSRNMSLYDPQVSSFYMDGDSQGILLVKKVGADTIETVFAGSNEESYDILEALAAYSAQKASETCGQTANVSIHVRTQKGNELLSRIIPGISLDKYELYTLEIEDSTGEQHGDY